jgi:hypothetical protein
VKKKKSTSHEISIPCFLLVKRKGKHELADNKKKKKVGQSFIKT